MTDVLVIGAGPAGVLAALRAADLGAQTALVTSGAFGGMAANDGPVPVRTLAHAGRLMREARQLGQYGVKVSEPVLDYSRLFAKSIARRQGTYRDVFYFSAHDCGPDNSTPRNGEGKFPLSDQRAGAATASLCSH